MNFRLKKHDKYDSSDDSNGEDPSFEEEEKGFKPEKKSGSESFRIDNQEQKEKFFKYLNLTRIKDEEKTKKYLHLT